MYLSMQLIADIF